MATKLAAQVLRKNQLEITELNKTVTAQVQELETVNTKDRAFKLAAKLVVGEDTLVEIQEKAASLMREDLDVVEKAMSLGLSQGLKLGHVLDSDGDFSETSATNALIDCLAKLSTSS
ncbi:MAG: hypothetical protein DRN14_06595 [Thermoplasmata archaeon]|nr:MAG: hypothetical protein DRN14_06595 [Thermoplasmata archaeon]